MEESQASSADRRRRRRQIKNRREHGGETQRVELAFASVHSHTGTRDGLAARRRSLREDMAPKSKRKAKRKRTDAQDARAVAIEGLAAGHEHASDMGIYRHAGREVNGRGVWASVGHHAAYLFYSAMGSWCVSDATDMAAGEHQGSLMVESDAETPDAITESWSVHGTMLTCAPCRSRAVPTF